MKDNPYSKMAEMMKQEKTSGLELATVVSSAPLTVKIGDLQIDGNNLLVADHLVGGSYKVNIPLGSTGVASGHSHGMGVVSDMPFVNSLKSGDLLVVYPISNNQIYVILARVVSV